MSILFDRLELLELFDEEKIIDEEIKMAFYLVKDKAETTLSMFLLPYEDILSLTVKLKESGSSICSVESRSIRELRVDRAIPGMVRLLIFREKEEEPSIIVIIKPNIMVQCSF